MMRSVFFILLPFIFSSLAAQQLEMNIRHPADNDTLNRARTRLSANVSDTNAVVTINEDTLKVYRIGVFVDLLELAPGWNQFVFTADNQKQILRDTINVFRTEPVKALPEQPTKFADDFLMPLSNAVYYDQDEIIVQFRGSPGGKAMFEIDGLMDDPLPMMEIEANGKGNIAGVYRGVYRIKPNDECIDEPIVFYLEGKNEDEEEWETDRIVTVEQSGQPFLIETTCENNLVYYKPGGEIFLELPEAMRLNVIADHGRWLKVHIAENISGSISARCIRKIGKGDILPAAFYSGCSSALENDWLIFNMRISEKVPYKIIQKSEPQRIELTLYRTSVGGEWSVLPVNDAIHHPDSSFFKNFEWKQVSDDELRFTFYLNTSQQWGFKGGFEDRIFKLAMRQPPVINLENPFKNLIIALDAGHGGDHSGAVGASGYEEKEANLIYTRHLEKILTDAGATVILTRTSDTTMSLQSRAVIAREHNAHMLIWLHNNSIGSTSDPESVKGASTYYTHAQGMPFALYVYPELLDLGLDNFGRVHRTYYITRQTDFVVFLVEGAFLSNPEDEIFLMNEVNLKNLAQAVFDGMERYLVKLAESEMVE